MSDGKYSSIILTKQITDEGTEFILVKNNKIVGKYLNNDYDLREILINIMNFLKK